jgi:thiosulfate dehydrogenase (quinone) large subunit
MGQHRWSLPACAVTCVPFPSMPAPRRSNAPAEIGTLRLPGSILQGILARSALVFLRLYLGVVFLVSGTDRLQGDPAASLRTSFTGVASQSGYEFYRRFVEAVVLPHLGPVATLVSWSEVLIGFALVVGLATRFSAFLGLLLLVNYMLAKGAWFGQPSSNDAALAALAFALIIGAAGRTFGLDALLARRWGRSPFW